MKRHFTWPSVLAACTLFAIMALSAGQGQAQDATIDFAVPGPADWNTASNWLIPNVVDLFVPGDGFPDEVVSISNAGIAELTMPAAHNVAGVVLGETFDPMRMGSVMEEEGTLNISGTGQLRLIDPTGGGNAALRVGDAGLGILNLSGGSALADSVTVAGAANSALNLSGNGTLAISGDAVLQRITRIEGPNVLFDIEGNLRVRGTFMPVITGPAHSPITVSTGNANVGGALQVQFSGHVPSVGESWSLVEAASLSGAFAAPQISGAAAVQGAVFQTVANGGNLELRYTNVLTLSVNRRTGAASIDNHIGNIDFDAYSISSASGELTTAGWNSLEASGETGWFEANPTATHISELNPNTSSVLGPGGSLALGSIIATPGAFGEPDPVLRFQYHQTGDVIVSGVVDLVGPHNNLVLLVDPATGEAAIQNQSLETIRLDGYSIGSSAGSLDPAAWNSLQDSGLGGASWFEANPSVNRLNELNPNADFLLPAGGAPVPIGIAFDTGVAVQDLTFEFHLAGGGGGPLGDTNGDGVVNIDDLNNVRNNFGGGGIGDTNGDGVVNIDDLNNVRNNFGAMNGGGGPDGLFQGAVEYVTLPALAQAVPEPSSLVIVMLGAVALLLPHRGGVRPRN